MAENDTNKQPTSETASTKGSPPREGVVDVVALGSSCVDQIFAIDDIMRLNLTDRNKEEKKYLAIEVSTKLNVKNVSFFPGGSAANIATDLAIIGKKTAFFGGVGVDPPGQSCKNDFVKNGVDTSGLHEFDKATGLSVILITPWGRDRSIMSFKGASDLYSADFCKDEIIQNAKCFVWTSLTSDSGIGAIEHCLRVARKSNLLIVGAPSVSIIQKRPADASHLLRQCSVTSMNEEELELLTGEKDVKAGVRVLLSWGLKIVQITMGKEGALLANKEFNKLVRTTPPTVTVSDTTGAGDASLSGLILGILNGKGPEECARYAAGMSAMEIETVGVRCGIPMKIEQLEEFISNHTIHQEVFPLTE